MTGKMRRHVVTPSVVVLAAAAFLTGCGAGEPDDVVYCVDKDNVIVDDSKCDDSTGTHGNGAFWYMMGRYSPGLTPGTRLDPGLSTARFSSTDSAARTKAGFSPTGKISTGKSAGFGTGSGKSGGFGGSGHGGSGHGGSGGS